MIRAPRRGVGPWGTPVRVVIVAFAAALAACSVGGASGADGGTGRRDVGAIRFVLPDGMSPEAGTPPPPSDAGVDSGFPFEGYRLDVQLVPQVGVHGVQRIAFGLPLPEGVVTDTEKVRVERDGIEIPSSRVVLARWLDGSIESVGIQIDREMDGASSVVVTLGIPSTAGPIRPIPIEDTMLDPKDEAVGPNVWVRLPPGWLLATRIAGPEVAERAVDGTLFDGWNYLCDYGRWGAAAPPASLAATYMYDRATVFYRGYVRHPDLPTYIEAYRVAARYRGLLYGHGAETRVVIPGAVDDPQMYYAQGLALTYLMTGDTRYRESAEDVADALAVLWPAAQRRPDVPGWTEQKAGLALLTWVWAMEVSDDRADVYRALADDAVDTWLAAQRPLRGGPSDEGCFPHLRPNDGGYYGCSPWQSALLAEALEAYATVRGGDRADRARSAIVKLGRMIANDSIAAWGPVDFVGIDGVHFDGMHDDERWGDTAYVVALAFAEDGRRDVGLYTTALDLVGSVRYRATASDVTSFDRQCRTAPATAWYLATWSPPRW